MIIEELYALLGFKMDDDAALKRFNNGLNNAARNVANFARQAALMGAAVGAAVGAGIGKLGIDAVKVGSTFEDLKATLETVEGSSEKAQKSLEWVKEFATKTPYDLQQVSEAFVRLKANGLDPQAGLLRSIGDASSAMGKSMMDGVEAIADAVRGENERLKEFGINASVAGDKVTYSWDQNGKQMTRTVAKNSAEMQKAIQGIFDQRFFGAMEKRSGTFSGIVSNIQDMWTNFLLKISDSGMFSWVKAQFDSLLKLMQGWSDDGTMDRVATGISDAFISMGEGIKQMFAGTKPEDIVQFVEGLMQFGLGVMQLVKSLILSIKWAGELISSMLGLANTWQGVMVLFAMAGLVFAPLLTAVGALMLVLDDFVAWMQGRPSLIGAALSAIKSRFTSWAPSIKSAWLSVMSVLKKAPQFKFMEGFIGRLKQADLGAIFKSWRETGSDLWDAIKSLGTAFSDLGTALGKLMVSDDGQATLLSRFATALGQLAGSSVLAGLSMLQGVIRSIANGIQTFAGVISRLSQGDLAGALEEFAKGAERQAKLVKDAVEGMIKAFIPDFSFEEQWNAVIAWFEGFVADVEALAQRVKAALSNMFPEPPDWWKKLTGADTERRNASDAGKSIGGMLKPKQAADNGVPSSTIQDLTNIAATLQNVSGPQATEKAVNTVANDNRVTTVNNTVNAPVQVTATTNATPAQIGQAAGNGVQRAGSNINRNLAVTSAPGGMAK